MDHPYNATALLILDLDGTVRECTVEGQPCPNKPGEQRLLPGAAAGIRAALDADITVGFATNQGGISLGYMSEAAFHNIGAELFDLLGTAGVDVEHDELGSIKYCSESRPCFWRKPSPGMLLALMVEFEVEPHATLFVGDRDTDREAAERAGCRFLDAAEWRALFPA